MAQTFPVSAYGQNGGGGVDNGGGQPQQPQQQQGYKLPAIPQVMVKVDQLASRVPWWIWLLIGGVGVYWMAKRGNLRKLLSQIAKGK